MIHKVIHPRPPAKQQRFLLSQTRTSKVKDSILLRNLDPLRNVFCKMFDEMHN